MDESVRQLLHECDGMLGLAVYRGDGARDIWKADAEALIHRIRAALKESTLGEQEATPPDDEWADVVACWENFDTRTHADIYYAVELVMSDRAAAAPQGEAS